MLKAMPPRLMLAGRKEPKRLTAEEIEVVEAEIDRQRILAALVREAVHNTNTAEDYRIMMTKARGDYARDSRPRGPLRRALGRALGVYGLIVMAVSGELRAR